MSIAALRQRSPSSPQRGVEARLVVGMPKPQVDPILLRTLRDAHRWVDALRSGTPINALAPEPENRGPEMQRELRGILR